VISDRRATYADDAVDVDHRFDQRKTGPSPRAVARLGEWLVEHDVAEVQPQNDFVTLPSRVTTVAGPVAPMTVMA
jgi:hypothetical protein